MTTQSTTTPEVNSPTARRIAAEMHMAADAVESTVPELKAKLRHMVDGTKARAAEWKGGFQEGIREKPIQSVLIAAAVGTVVGLLIGRRSN